MPEKREVKKKVNKLAVILIILVVLVLIAIGFVGYIVLKEKPAGNPGLTEMQKILDEATQNKDVSSCEKLDVSLLKISCKIEVNALLGRTDYCAELGNEKATFPRLFNNKTIEFSAEEECLRRMAVRTDGSCSLLSGDEKDVCIADGGKS